MIMVPVANRLPFVASPYSNRLKRQCNYFVQKNSEYGAEKKQK
jgi:hypothetical protein